MKKISLIAVYITGIVLVNISLLFLISVPTYFIWLYVSLTDGISSIPHMTYFEIFSILCIVRILGIVFRGFNLNQFNKNVPQKKNDESMPMQSKSNARFSI